MSLINPWNNLRTFFWRAYFGPTFCEGPMDLSLSVRPYVHFLSQDFSQDWLISCFFFYIFCMKLRDHKYSKLTEPNFLEKFFFAKTGQKSLKWSVYLFVHYGSSFSQNWLIKFVSYFAWSLRPISAQNWGSKVFWENSHLPENGPKCPKMPWFVCLSITATFFLGIRSLVFSDILYEVVGP